MKIVHLFCAGILVSSLFLAGCGGSDGKKDSAPKKDGHGDHDKKGEAKDGHKDKHHKDGKEDHAHKPGAHGGIIVSLGTDSYHAEAVFAHGGVLKLYPLGKDETKAIDVDSQVLKAHVKEEGGEAVKMDLKPEPQKGDKAGRTSLFVGNLPKGLIDKKVVVTIPTIMIDGERFRLVINSSESKHGEGDHKGHKDHKDPKHHKEHSKHEAEEDIKAARAKLGVEDRKLVDAQEWCVVMTDNRLGEMGVPFKLMVKDQPVFLCCKGCRTKALANPEKTLAKLEEFRAKVKADSGKK